MPATSCPGYTMLENRPIILMKESVDRDYLQRKYHDARKHRISPKWSFTEVIEKLPLESTPNKRPIPSFARDGGQFRFQPVVALQPASFLEAESELMSQVWVANVFNADVGATVQHGQPERVILKILQPSMRPFPELYTDGRWIRPGPAAFQLAYSEEVLYQQLRPLQGSHVPYYFGTFQVVLPNGEDAYILILEYIEGEVLQDWKKKYGTNELHEREVLSVIIHSLIDGFRAIHAARVAHTDLDMDLTNMIVRPDGTVVIIDFAECAILEGPAETEKYVREMTWGMDNQAYPCVLALVHLCLRHAGEEARAALEDWANTPGNIPAEVLYPDGPPRPADDGDDGDVDDSSFYSSGTDSDEDQGSDASFFR